MTATPGEGWALIRRLVADLRRPLVPGIVAGIGWQAAALALPLVIGWTVQRGIVDDDRSAIWLGALAVALLGSVEALLSAVRHRAAVTLYAESLASLREGIMRTTLAEDVGLDTGEVIGRATGDVEMLAECLDAICHTVAHLVSVPIVIAVLFVIDPQIGITVTAAMLALAVIMWRYSHAWVTTGEAVQQAYADTAGRAEELVEGFKVIRGLGAEDQVVARYAESSETLRRRSTTLGWYWVRFEPTLDVLSAIAVAAVVWFGGEGVIDGGLELGALVSAIGLVLLIADPVRTLGQRVVTVQLALVSARRVAAITTLAEPDLEPDRRPGAAGTEHRAPRTGPTLAVRRLTIGERDHPLLSDLDLTLAPASMVLLDGPVGVGKTTLLRTVCGDRPPLAGAVELDGRPVAGLSDRERRRLVLLCGPQPFLFGTSIADNIGFARASAGDDAIRRAADVADVTEFVAGLDDGLATLVGERGVTLSGGQRQRIGLARAVLAEPAVLLLDGATTAVEPARELRLLERIRAALPLTTIVVVSPNPGIAGLADGRIDLGTITGAVTGSIARPVEGTVTP